MKDSEGKLLSYKIFFSLNRFFLYCLNLGTSKLLKNQFILIYSY